MNYICSETEKIKRILFGHGFREICLNMKPINNIENFVNGMKDQIVKM